MTETMKQLEVWQGEFGRAYTDRNAVDWHVRSPAFRTMLCGLQLYRVLEVGCNRGHNLQTLLELLPNGTEIVGVEPNIYALTLARSTSAEFSVVPGNILDLPFKDHYFDLAFTANVLIHVPPEHRACAMLEIARVSRRYVLAIEYYDEKDTVIEYRGHTDLLWKGDFLKHYQDNVPNLKVVASGYWDQKDGFDRSHWWLMEKGTRPS